MGLGEDDKCPMSYHGSGIHAMLTLHQDPHAKGVLCKINLARDVVSIERLKRFQMNIPTYGSHSSSII